MGEQKKVSMTRAIRRYKSLFTFPDYWVLALLTAVVDVLGGMLAFFLIYPSVAGAFRGFLFGFQVLTVPTVLVDVVSARLVTRGDAIFNLKRSASLSIVICGAWIIALNTGAVLQKVTGIPLLIYASIFGACVAFSLRFLVFSSVSQMRVWKMVVVVMLQPAVCLLSALFFWGSFDLLLLSAIFASTAILAIAAYVFVSLVDRRGVLAIGIGAIQLFKGFLANWIGGLTYPLESYFERLGSVADVSVSILAFGGEKSLKAVMVIPSIHPGPFRNLGSSGLPFALQKALGEKFNAVTMVPHGTSGHELDLTSQPQCERVLRETLGLADFSKFSSLATTFVREEVGLGKATCQLFGGVALVTITCAPESMEDVPREVGLEIAKDGKALGVEEVVVIDAHNSIGDEGEVPSLSEEELQFLKLAAHKAIEEALRESGMPFEVGVAQVFPEEFGLAEGIGPGGIVALVVVVGRQKVAYVTIDGNNMVSGLREEILASLGDLVDDSEVLTTDTHTVNAVSSIRRGYHPVGEVVNNESLIGYVREAVGKALAGVGRVNFSSRTGEVKDVKVIGEEKLVGLSTLVDSTFKFTAWLSPLIFIPAVAASLLPFFFLIG
ncbi:MAG: putative rane protein [Thermoproteota archaeon]|nr:putative rane protein [Thermoproteota archaeon]